ncbi:hypothetical protein M885DRAFT_624123 [Pelagophyceae sp. CCMP2097]|nr:hypothetical protein M885DRAFT_624123 [Pelagophyceae sp. CCMP2097]|mmetsp:Transcript_10970/g.36658  ORF Transcript_10970/g.36658 Transcript_10970/m.36658 type:complete len:175 (+) Transcript_10970:73-597(+)
MLRLCVLAVGWACASALAPRPLARRRGVLTGFGGAAALQLAPLAASASVKKYSVEDAKAAISEIKAARNALNNVDALLAANDFDAVDALLGSAPVSEFEKDATVILQAPVLSAEDKKAIGTIKRYGVGADVTIMLGGLKAASAESNGGDCRNYLAKAKSALDELILIAKGGGLK